MSTTFKKKFNNNKEVIMNFHDIKDKREVFFAKMDYGNGTDYLEVWIDKEKENIYFLRDENGVGAWHCGHLPITDYRILKIKPYYDLKCKRCAHEWLRKGDKIPLTCPGCKSPYWEKELTLYWKEVRRKNAERKQRR